MTAEVKRLVKAADAATNLLVHLTSDVCDPEDLKITQELSEAKQAVQKSSRRKKGRTA
jgi:hypothetical protein